MEFNGVTIEKYADLCALMADTAGDESKEIAIAEANGVTGNDWLEAKKSFTAQMSDPNDMGKTALAFMPLYQAAQDRLRGGGEPCSLETYSKVHAEMAFRKNPDNPEEKIDFMIVLNEHGFEHHKWLECEGYWTPRVSDPQNEKFDQALATRFSAQIQQESDRILGIQRD